MFDFHMHSTVSFDGLDPAEKMVKAAADRGLKEICFTDHIDHEVREPKLNMIFDTAVYNATYDHLEVPGMKIRKGVEFGLKPGNQAQIKEDLQRRHFDFVLGSVHFVDEIDVYLAPFWVDKTVPQATKMFLETTYTCVKNHEDFDVLAHLTFLSKGRAHPTHELIHMKDWQEIVDEILKELVKKGKGLELNTSGMERCGDFLPSEEYFRRFKELGGEIVTVGSDAHTADRVGQYTDRACQMLKDIFGYVCTFEDRKPIFHKL